MTRDEALETIRSAALPYEQAEALADSLRPAFRIAALPTEMKDLPSGVSRFGGMPDAGPEFQWPHREGRPMAFLAQIDLTALPLDGLDVEALGGGRLLFFYDDEDQPWGFDPVDGGGWRVLFDRSKVDDLRRVPFPETLHAEHRYRPCALVFEPAQSVDTELAYDWNSDDEELGELFESVCQQLNGDPEAQRMHRLFGHPFVIQGDMRLECQLVTNGLYCGDSSGYEDPRAKALAAGADGWRLLLQLDSDEDGPGWGWGDAGCLYFWIHERDLAQGDLASVWLIQQCY